MYDAGFKALAALTRVLEMGFTRLSRRQEAKDLGLRVSGLRFGLSGSRISQHSCAGELSSEVRVERKIRFQGLELPIQGSRAHLAQWYGLSVCVS